MRSLVLFAAIAVAAPAIAQQAPAAQDFAVQQPGARIGGRWGARGNDRLNAPLTPLPQQRLDPAATRAVPGSIVPGYGSSADPGNGDRISVPR